MTPIAAPIPPASSVLTRIAVGVSVIVHVAAVLLSLGYAGAGMFESSEPEAVQVSLVAPDEAPPEPQAKPDDPDLRQLDLRTTPFEPDPSPQRETAAQQTAAASPQSDQQPPQPQPAPAASTPPAAQPSYTQPPPDISMRYGVDLGLKMLAPAAITASAQDGHSDFDAPAMKNAEIDRGHVAAFRARLKQCAALPPQIAPDDKVVIVLRASFTPDAKLAAAPVLIEASASAKGPALMQAAIRALESCQPHNALPANDYAEWRVLDLRFTPQDFKRG